jgi:polyhydroxyalkanoate synthesis regulator protein
MSGSGQPVSIKRYGGSRLYHAAEGRYVSLEDLGCMIEGDEDFVVRDVTSGTDITALILKQIITERAHHG